jgi:nucleoside-diphosphate-sugar epimerase
MKIFVAGATGVVGQRLVALLVRAGHRVAGTTRSAAKVLMLESMGAAPAVVDVFDGEALADVVRAAAPDVIVHQLTDLPDVDDPSARNDVRVRNARLRRDGTRNLMAAAHVAGVRRVIAQSIAFAYAPGPMPHLEADPLDASGASKVSIEGVMALESAVLTTPGIEGLVLRYGRFYGPGTWTETVASPPALHVDAAAQAALLAVSRGAPGIYNIAEDDGAVAIGKARAQLGFDPGFRIVL